MCVRTYVYVCIYIYTHTHTHTSTYRDGRRVLRHLGPLAVDPHAHRVCLDAQQLPRKRPDLAEGEGREGGRELLAAVPRVTPDGDFLPQPLRLLAHLGVLLEDAGAQRRLVRLELRGDAGAARGDVVQEGAQEALRRRVQGRRVLEGALDQDGEAVDRGRVGCHQRLGPARHDVPELLLRAQLYVYK